MDYQNPYATPNSNLTLTSQSGDRPTIEEALARGYDFEIGEVISEAWQKTEGFKLTTLIVYIILIACAIPVVLIGAFIPVIGGMLSNAVLAVLAAGIYSMVLNHYRDEPTEIGQMFKYFSLFTPIFLLTLVTGLLTMVGMILLIIPGIYLAVAYSLGLWILIENQELSFWDAMEGSRKAISQHWFKFFFLGLALGVINLIAAIPLGIGLFWTLPLSLLSMAVVYERIFGVR